MARHFRQLKIEEVKNETEECVSVSFIVPPEWSEEFKFRAGQNVTLRSDIEGAELRRSYSICNSPTENSLRIAIKKLEGGKFSSHAHKHFVKGQLLDVMAPTGNFYLSIDPENKKHYIAFAAGSGITPIISILKTVLKEEPLSRFTLIYGNRMRSSVIFREDLLELKNRYPGRFQLLHVFSREKMDAPIFEGRIDQQKCEMIFDHILPMAGDQEYLLCGPAEMISSVKSWLLSRQISDNKIHFELFADPGTGFSSVNKVIPDNEKTQDQKSLVTIRIDGVSADFLVPYEGPSILDIAGRAGADLPYACRAGVCATCRAKLVKGSVIMDQNYSLAEEEIEQGFILACQSHPDSSEIIIDFDIR